MKNEIPQPIARPHFPALTLLSGWGIGLLLDWMNKHQDKFLLEVPNSQTGAHAPMGPQAQWGSWCPVGKSKTQGHLALTAEGEEAFEEQFKFPARALAILALAFGWLVPEIERRADGTSATRLRRRFALHDRRMVFFLDGAWVGAQKPKPAAAGRWMHALGVSTPRLPIHLERKLAGLEESCRRAMGVKT